MNNENEIINNYLNPLLGNIMNESLQNILNMKEEGLLNDIEDKNFILEFLEDATEYYININNQDNLRKILDLTTEIKGLI